MDPKTTAALEKFILRPNIFESENVPRNLPRAEVNEFLRTRIDDKTRLKSLRQAEKVIDFYDLQEICDHLQSLLGKEEVAEDAVLRQIVLDRSLGRVCVPSELEFAKQRYIELIARASTSAELQELVLLNDAVADPEAAVRLHKRVAERREAGAADDYQARLEFHKLEEIGDLWLPRSEKANAVKEGILKIADRPRRIAEEIKMYLTVEYGYLEFLQPWAARRLRRETWGEQPDQQVIFKEDASLRAELAKTFHRTADALAEFPHLDPENLPSLRVRCLRATAFFGMHPALADVEYIREHAGSQSDILSTE
jgi:hypothetical protein